MARSTSCASTESQHMIGGCFLAQISWKYMNLYLMISVFLSLVVGVYVNGQGCRSRKQEILWHSPPASFGNIHTYVHACLRAI